MDDITKSKPERVFWLQGWEGRVIQGGLYRSDNIPTTYGNKEEMKKQFDNKHGTTGFVEGKLFKENQDE